MLWTQLCGHRLTGQNEQLATFVSACAGQALELLQQAQQAEPTLIELHSVHARFLKHGGDPRGAAQAAVHAESLDTADRYTLGTRQGFPSWGTCAAAKAGSFDISGRAEGLALWKGGTPSAQLHSQAGLV